MIETYLPGSFGELINAGIWLTNLGDTMTSSLDRDKEATSSSGSQWASDSHEAYASSVSTIVSAGDPRADIAKECSTAVITYAWELQACQLLMMDYRQRAAAGGLKVNGTVIEAPVVPAAPSRPPADASPQAFAQFADREAAHNAGLAQQQLYFELSQEAQSTLARVENSINQTLLPAHAKAISESELSDLLKKATSAAAAAGVAISFGSSYFATRSNRLFRAGAESAINLARRRSGNPLVKFGKLSPSTKGLINASKSGTRGGKLLSESGRFGKWGKWLGRAGTVILVASGVHSIYEGESPGKVILSATASIAAAAAVGAAAGAVSISIPPVVVAVVATAAAIGVAMATEYAWDHVVPEGVKSAIDDGANAVWDAGAGVAKGIGDAASGAWNSVFG